LKSPQIAFIPLKKRDSTHSAADVKSTLMGGGMMIDRGMGALLALIFGASLGSFAGVVAYRLPREISLVTPRSFCPHCKRPLSLWSNIPLVSYVLLRGRCASCRAPIGFRYFLAELTLGAAAAYLYLHFPLVDAAVRLAFCTALLVIAFIDYDWRVIHNAITLGGIVAGLLAASFLMPEVGWRSSLTGFIAGAGFLFLTGALYSILRGAEGVGLGDVYLLGMVGAFLGVAGAIFTIFFGSIFGAVGGLAFALTGGAPPPPEDEIPEAIAAVTGAGRSDPGRSDAVVEEVSLLRTAVPFGPFLAFAAAVFALFQPQLLSWYFAR
jgi:leader peptidase (prepilin peptidase)/N-methyltransferase